MQYRLGFTPQAEHNLRDLEFGVVKDPLSLKQVRRCLGFLETNPEYALVNAHEYTSLEGKKHEKVWEASASEDWRLFWHYGPGKGIITVIAIVKAR